jgi:adenylate kinase
MKKQDRNKRKHELVIFCLDLELLMCYNLPIGGFCMIFISGIHGVGKSYFCDKVKAELGIETFSASRLISNRKHAGFTSDKLIPDIDDNQQYLIIAVKELNLSTHDYLLDGHFCLLNSEGHVTRISEETFMKLHPNAIVLLTEKPEVIAERRKQRDGIDHNADDIRSFQQEEVAYATEISETLGIPLKISTGIDDLDNSLEFVRATIRSGVCQGSCRIFFNCFSQSSVHPHLFHGSLDNEPLIACV